MRLSLHSDRLARRHWQARRHDWLETGAVLGDRHPLVATLARIDTSMEQLLCVAAVHAASLGLWAEGWVGPELVAGAIVAEAVLGGRRVVLHARRRDLCLDLIVQGNESLPVAAVAAERARLLAPRHQEQLARALERIVCPEPVCSVLLTARPIVHARVVNELASELDELTQLLRARQLSACGVALVERLISSPMSPLYGTDPVELAHELGRVRYFA